MTPVNSIRLEGDAERSRQSHAQAITELQRAPCAATELLEDVVLPDNAESVVSHHLGRTPRMIIISPPRGASTAGVIRDFAAKSVATGVSYDPSRFIVLRADGWGSTITVDIEVK